MKSQSLELKTVVITGASSGIGKAAALKFAEERANVVLASRSDEILHEVAEKCEALGARTLVVATDVSNKDSVRNLFERSVETFDSIDVWINNAGVGAIGEFTDTPLEAHEQIIRTNLFGPLYGCYCVLPHFKERNSGIIINVNSTGAFVGNPFTAAYSASKFGLRGFTEALRFEMKGHKDIHICELYAGIVDSPAHSHAANYMGKEVKPGGPLVDPIVMAESLVKLAKKPRPAMHIGSQDRLGRFGHFVSTEMTGTIMKKVFDIYFSKAKDVPVSDGNLFRPDKDKHPPIHGGFS